MLSWCCTHVVLGSWGLTDVRGSTSAIPAITLTPLIRLRLSPVCPCRTAPLSLLFTLCSSNSYPGEKYINYLRICSVSLFAFWVFTCGRKLCDWLGDTLFMYLRYLKDERLVTAIFSNQFFFLPQGQKQRAASDARRRCCESISNSYDGIASMF